MRAARHRRYGTPDVLEVCEVETPMPGPKDVLVRVRATTVTAAESGMRQGRPIWGRVILGPFAPRRGMQVQGLEYAGVVDTVGTEVTSLRPGERVFGFAGFRPGACAEYLRVAADSSIAPMPAALSFEQAVWRLAGMPATVHGLVDRGFLREGAWADVLVIDRAKLRAGSARLARDFPADTERYVVDADGYAAVVVNGQVLLEHGRHTGALPGHVLRGA